MNPFMIIVNVLAWRWFDKNRDEVVFRLHIAGNVVTRAFRVKEIKETLELLVGKRRGKYEENSENVIASSENTEAKDGNNAEDGKSNEQKVTVA